MFNTIARSAARLCEAVFGAVYRVEGGQIQIAAETSIGPAGLARARRIFPIPLAATGDSAVVRALFERSVVQVSDSEAPEAPGLTREAGRVIGFRSQLTVPMLRDGDPIGAVNVARREPGDFSQTQIDLLKTFADQAVIAIENVRLFTELEAKNTALTQAHAHVTEALEQQTATSEILRIIASSPTDLESVLQTVIASAVRLAGGEQGHIRQHDGELLQMVVQFNESDDFIRTIQTIPVRPTNQSAVGRAFLTQRPVHISDVLADPGYSGPALPLRARTVLAVPMLREGVAIGTISMWRSHVEPFTERQIELVTSFADQAVIAIENARLFKELKAANHELAAASQHKSEFLANMSHELRTPLNAIIGFSEVLSEKMFGELNEKQEEYSKDIHASGEHLLSLINDILDLSKIEAGRMELELTDFDLPTAIENALMLVRERVGRRSIALQTHIDNRLGQIRADERKVRQVVLNLLSNAIKFTPEGGRIDVGAVPNDGFVQVSVRDTGIGIAPEDQEKVFEEFRQVGTAAKKVEGTGLGLTLCRKFVEVHGGRIWVKSVLGAGSTFTFTIPIRRTD